MKKKPKFKLRDRVYVYASQWGSGTVAQCIPHPNDTYAYEIIYDYIHSDMPNRVMEQQLRRIPKKDELC